MFHDGTEYWAMHRLYKKIDCFSPRWKWIIDAKASFVIAPTAKALGYKRTIASAGSARSSCHNTEERNQNRTQWMKIHAMIIIRNLNTVHLPSLPHLTGGFNTIPMETPAGLQGYVCKLILQPKWRDRCPRQGKTILENNNTVRDWGDLITQSQLGSSFGKWNSKRRNWWV